MPGLYVHIPFCEQKCLYCDFYSVAAARFGSQGGEAKERFVADLESELDLRSRTHGQDVLFNSLFFGGGTPSLLDVEQLARILDRVQVLFKVDGTAEITLEANPGTINPAKLRAFRSMGINRLSIGVQSFRDEDLRFLSRIHTSQQARDAVTEAQGAGFENVSIDLLFGLPGQTPAAWLENLETAVGLKPTHLSCYSLIVEPGTPLHRLVEGGTVTLPDADRDADLYAQTISFLTGRGFVQYEVSNFALPGYHSHHNSTYWNHGPYLGFGPSAHSFWGGCRWWNTADLDRYHEYLQRGLLPVSGEEQLTPRELMTEEVFLGLRSDGIDVAGFRQRYAVDLMEKRRDELSDFIARRLLVQEEGRLRCTALGYQVCDALSAALLPNEVS